MVDKNDNSNKNKDENHGQIITEKYKLLKNNWKINLTVNKVTKLINNNTK